MSWVAFHSPSPESVTWMLCGHMGYLFSSIIYHTCKTYVKFRALLSMLYSKSLEISYTRIKKRKKKEKNSQIQTESREWVVFSQSQLKKSASRGPFLKNHWTKSEAFRINHSVLKIAMQITKMILNNWQISYYVTISLPHYSQLRSAKSRYVPGICRLVRTPWLTHPYWTNNKLRQSQRVMKQFPGLMEKSRQHQGFSELSKYF
jgi:hypothetical protein